MQFLNIWVFILILKCFCDCSSNKTCPEGVDIRLLKKITDGEKTDSNIVHQNLSYTNEDYFIGETKSGIDIYGCPCNIKPCYKKCCPKGQLLTTKCVNNNKSTKYYDEIEIFDHKTATNLTIEENFAEIYDMRCYSGIIRILKRQNGDEIYLQKNGSLLYTVAGYDHWVKPQNFCMEKYDQEDFKETTALVCLAKIIKDNSSVIKTYSALLIIVLPFYLTIFLVYTLISELRTFHGICLANYSICLFIAFLFLVVVYLRKITGGLCIFFALSTYFTFMASFFWLNGMCIDAWLTFRGGGMYFSLSKKKKIIYYSIYAWGAAGVCLFVVMFLQFLGPKHFPYLILPKIGVESCWFPDNQTRGLYLYGIIMFLMIINIILFLLTANNIWKAKQQTKKSLKSDSQRHCAGDKQRFLLYLKLFIAFGVNWSFELLPWLTGQTFKFQKYLDIINILYGVVIFIIAICSKNVLKTLKNKYSDSSWMKSIYTTYFTHMSSTVSTTN